MKRKPIITLALVASITSTAFAGFSAPLPEFKTPKQLAEWRAEMAAKSVPKPTTTQNTAFYTGKPYLVLSETYAFKYRNYNPEMARWTSEDPSGFPDGANQLKYGINNPVLGFDPDGLAWAFKLLGDNSNPNNGNSGRVSTSWISDDENIRASASLYTSINQYSAVQSGIVSATGRGRIWPYHEWDSVVQNTFDISVNSSGEISITPGTGGWNNSDNDLSTAATYSVTALGDHQYKLTYDVSSIYQGSGLTGAGIAGGSVAWTSGAGKVDAFVSLTFKAFE